MGPVELRMVFNTAAALERELQDNLRLGRAFVQDPTRTEREDVPEVLSDCTLVLIHPDDDRELRLSAQVVMVAGVGPAGAAIGVELRPFNPTVVETVTSFVGHGDASTTASGPEPMPPSVEQDACTGRSSEAAAETAPDDGASALDAEASEGELEEVRAFLDDDTDGGSPERDGAKGDEGEDLEGLDEDAFEAEWGEPGPDSQRPSRHPTSAPPQRSVDVQPETRQAKLRKLSYNQQQKVARTGDLSDRVQVERLYGKSVWRSLLDNPKLTVPEVARIARKGTVPRPLLEIIMDNNQWVHATPVRRALMSNPKVTPESVMKLLRITPKHELRLIHKGTAYTPFIREQARKLLMGSG